MNGFIWQYYFCNLAMILGDIKKMRAPFVIGYLFILGLTIMSAVRLIYLQHKLYVYLRENYTEKWKYLTTVWSFGPGLANSWKGIKFLLSKDDFGDPKLTYLKVVCKNSLIYIITGIGGSLIMFCLMAYAFIKK